MAFVADLKWCQHSNSEPKDSNEGNERQPELSERTQSNQHNERIGTNWHNQFTEPFQFVKSNKNNPNPQTTSTVNNSAKFKSHQLLDKQLRKSKALIAQEGITNSPQRTAVTTLTVTAMKGQTNETIRVQRFLQRIKHPNYKLLGEAQLTNKEHNRTIA